MNFIDEYEAEILEKDKAMLESGEWDKKMKEMKKKADDDMARMIANGAIDFESENEDEDDEE